MSVSSRTVAGIVLGLLLIAPAYFRSKSVSSEATSDVLPSEDQKQLTRRFGFHLSESALEAGIDFRHQEPDVDSMLHAIRPQVAAMGAAVSIVDFDRDGWSDIYVTNSAPDSQNRLYRNLGNGKFEDIASQVGLADMNRATQGACMGTVWADANNDGFEDVLIYRWGVTELYMNDGGTAFHVVREQTGLPTWANIGAATWLDYDRDGHIDLFLAGYWPDNINLRELASTRIMPESFEYANNGGRKWLLRNAGDGTFVDVTAEAGILSTRWTLAVVAADLNQDEFPDLFLANDYGNSEVYLNQGGHSFREVGRQCGAGYAPKSGMNAAVGDVFNRGQHAIYETNISEPGVLIQGNNLWIPSFTPDLHYENMASVAGVELGGWSFGAQFGDLNNDGHLDLYLTNGYISGDEGTSYWYDFSQIAGGHQRIIADAKNWPAMHGRSLSGYQSKHVWVNTGTGKFRDVAQIVGVTDRYDGRAVAIGDLLNHGALDIVVANQRGPLLLYRNHVAPDRHWIAFECEGTASNRSGIGTQIELHWSGKQQLQEVVAASGYASQNQRRLHFGLGSATSVDRAVVRWPGGTTEELVDLGVDQLHRIKEPQ